MLILVTYYLLIFILGKNYMDLDLVGISILLAWKETAKRLVAELKLEWIFGLALFEYYVKVLE